MQVCQFAFDFTQSALGQLNHKVARQLAGIAHPQHALAMAQQRGCGGAVVSFNLGAPAGDAVAARRNAFHLIDSTAILSYRVKQGVAPRGKGATTEQEMNDTSTWVKTDHGWRCAMHTETPIGTR